MICISPVSESIIPTLRYGGTAGKSSIRLSEKELTACLADVLWSFARRGDKPVYGYAGLRLCQAKFLLLWGISADKLRGATHMWRQGLVADTHGLLGVVRSHTKRDWVYSVLLHHLQEITEQIAGTDLNCACAVLMVCMCCLDGFWHLHDTVDVKAIHEHVLNEWRHPTVFRERPNSTTEPEEQMTRGVLNKVLSSPCVYAWCWCIHLRSHKS